MKTGDIVTVVLAACQPGRDPDPKEIEHFDLTSAATRTPFVEQFAATSGLTPEVIESALKRLYGRVVLAMRTAQPTTPMECYYAEDDQGLWLVRPDERGETRTQLTNFRAQIVADIVEDDGTTTTPRFFEVEATQGEVTRRARLSAKDFQAMLWVADTLGPKARVFPGPYYKEHAHAAIQELSEAIDHRHTYTHTGWRMIDETPCYLHNAGAITADGLRKNLYVTLGVKFARYRLPVPPNGPEAIEALQASLALRQLGPNNLMTLLLPTAYLAPLREFLLKEPPDFVTWVVGRTGHYKSEDAALVLAHFGDFSRLTLPTTFESTGNGLERLLHTPKDSLLVIDDYHPATSRRQAEAMEQVAARLLRGMGNQSARQRMRRDTTMQDDLPPRCLALVTAERLPEGHSNSARMFLVSVPPMAKDALDTLGEQLATYQDKTELYAKAMAVYLRWIARQWSTLMTTLLERFHTLRTEVRQAGCHAREPAQVAYLLLAWETFTQCAVAEGAITDQERTAILTEARTMLLEASAEHSAILAEEQISTRFLGYLRAGLTSKQIYLRDPEDEKPPDASTWGWTEKMSWDGGVKEYIPVQEPGRAQLIGYVDERYVYLIPKTLHQYLHQAAKQESKYWPVDATTLLRDLDSAGVIHIKRESDGKLRREVGKKIHGMTQRLVWVYRAMVEHEEGTTDEDSDVPF